MVEVLNRGNAPPAPPAPRARNTSRDTKRSPSTLATNSGSPVDSLAHRYQSMRLEFKKSATAIKPATRIIANEMKDLAGRARERKLMPEEYQGGSSAVSNLGMYGIREFAAVINPPQATILAVGAGVERPVVKYGALAKATIMTVTLSTDHRAVDGALGAELLVAFKGYIENPMAMLV